LARNQLGSDCDVATTTDRTYKEFPTEPTKGRATLRAEKSVPLQIGIS